MVKLITGLLTTLSVLMVTFGAAVVVAVALLPDDDE